MLVSEMNSPTAGRSLTQHRKIAVNFRRAAGRGRARRSWRSAGPGVREGAVGRISRRLALMPRWRSRAAACLLIQRQRVSLVWCTPCVLLQGPVLVQGVPAGADRAAPPAWHRSRREAEGAGTCYILCLIRSVELSPCSFGPTAAAGVLPPHWCPCRHLLLLSTLPCPAPSQPTYSLQAVQLALQCLSFDFVGTCLDESSEDLGTIQVPSGGWAVQAHVPAAVQAHVPSCAAATAAAAATGAGVVAQGKALPPAARNHAVLVLPCSALQPGARQ